MSNLHIAEIKLSELAALPKEIRMAIIKGLIDSAFSVLSKVAKVREEDLVEYDEFIRQIFSEVQTETGIAMPTTQRISEDKSRFIRLLMFFRSEFNSRIPHYDEAHYEALNDEHLAWLMRRQPEQ